MRPAPARTSLLVRCAWEVAYREMLPSLLIGHEVSQRGFQFRLEHVKAIRPRTAEREILFVPFYYDDLDRRRYLFEPHEGSAVVNLCYEQFHQPNARGFMMPSGDFARRDLQYCVWGRRYHDLLVSHGIDPSCIHIVGYPRFDIYAHPSLLVAREELAQRHGLDADRPWILVPYNFNVVYLSRGRRRQLRARGYDISDEMVSTARRTRDAFTAMVRDLSAAYPDAQLVMRVHPAGFESSALYAIATEGHSNIHLISALDVANWIVQAALVVVWTSTTSLEAIVANVPVVSYDPYAYAERFEYDVNRIVTTVSSAGDVVDIARDPGRAPAFNAALFEEWCGPRDGHVVNRIADLVERVSRDYERFAARTAADGWSWTRATRRVHAALGRKRPAEPAPDRVEQAVRSLNPSPLGEFLG